MKKILYSTLYLFAILFFGVTHVTAQTKQLSLREAVDLAKENNPELKISKLEIDKSNYQRTIARSLLLPTVSANAAVNHYFQLQPFFGFAGTTPEGKITFGRFGGSDQISGGILALQPLYNPQASPAIQRARLQEQESRLMLTGKQVSILSAIKQTYFQLLVLEERLKLQKESIARNQRVLKDSRVLFIQGKGLRVDTLRAYTLLKNLEPDVVKLTYAIETGKLQLKSFIGFESLNEIELTDSLSLPDPGSIPNDAEVYATALQNNSDVQLVALQQQISDQLVRQANASRLPVVSMVGSFNVQSQTNNFEYGNAYYPSSSYVGLQLSVPIFNGFSNQSKVRQAAISKEQSTLRVKNINEQLKATVHQAVANSHEAILRLKTAVTVRETAQLAYSIINYRYVKGIASRLELTDSELALTVSKSNYLEAVNDYLSARIVLEQIMNTTE